MRDTIDMAREAGIELDLIDEDEGQIWYITIEGMKAFEALVRADEREETNCRANASWTLMCEKMVAIERERVLKILDDQGTWAHVGDLIELVKGNT